MRIQGHLSTVNRIITVSVLLCIEIHVILRLLQTGTGELFFPRVYSVSFICILMICWSVWLRHEECFTSRNGSLMQNQDVHPRMINIDFEL